MDRACVRAILGKSTYSDLEILAVDNESTEPRTAETLSAFSALDPRFKVCRVPGPFNYARINNAAARAATAV